MAIGERSEGRQRQRTRQAPDERVQKDIMLASLIREGNSFIYRGPVKFSDCQTVRSRRWVEFVAEMLPKAYLRLSMAENRPP
jgi:hypothetical protein